jgi:phosphoglycerate dehydrogenase-like enzyme
MVRAVYPALAVAHDLETDDDYALERAALARVGVGLVRGDELREDMVSSVVALLTAGTRVSEHDLRRYPRLRVVAEFGTGYDAIGGSRCSSRPPTW